MPDLPTPEPDSGEHRPPRLAAGERLSRRGGFSPIDRLGYSVPTVEDVERAVTIIEDSRRTHEEWVDSLTHAPLPPASEDLVGDRDHHVRCMADYDHVLAVLRAAHPAAEEPR